MKAKFETYGGFSWYELLTTNIERAKQFYGQMLGWVMEKSPMEGEPYTVIKTGNRQVGGIIRMPSRFQPEPRRTGKRTSQPTMWTL